MIAFIQPFGLQGSGGGSRILRALLDTSHPPVVSINTGIYPAGPPLTVRELYVPIRRNMGRIERTRFGRHFPVMEGILRPIFEKRLRKALHEEQIKQIHFVAHAYDTVAVSRIASELNIPIFLSVHDDLEYTSHAHPRLQEMLKAMEEMWQNAASIYVISDEIGREYARRYGSREYHIVTDGLAKVANGPRKRSGQSLHVYFMGLFHLGYRPNLRALLDALKLIRMRHPTWDISVTCRSGSMYCPIRADDVPITVLPFAPESEVEKDMLAADLLYQPLPFDPASSGFAKFSMSTKQVTYLGSGLPILYHGPSNAAACTLLSKHDAGLICTNLDPETIAKQLLESAPRFEAIVRNALTLARERFMLADQQRRFWEPIKAAL